MESFQTGNPKKIIFWAFSNTEFCDDTRKLFIEKLKDRVDIGADRLCFLMCLLACCFAKFNMFSNLFPPPLQMHAWPFYIILLTLDIAHSPPLVERGPVLTIPKLPNYKAFRPRLWVKSMLDFFEILRTVLLITCSLEKPRLGRNRKLGIWVGKIFFVFQNGAGWKSVSFSSSHPLPKGEPTAFYWDPPLRPCPIETLGVLD